MNFLIISEVEHKINEQHQTGAFAPYVKEMNLWAKYVGHITIIAPYSKEPLTPIELTYDHHSITLRDVPFLNFTSPARIVRSLVSLPRTTLIMFKETELNAML